MFQHYRQYEIFFVRQMPCQHCIEGHKVSQKAPHPFALYGVLCRQHCIRPLGKAVEQRMQIMMVAVQHGKAALDPRLQRRQLREIGVILDLMMPDQVAQQPRPRPRQALRERVGCDFAVHPRLRICPQHRHCAAKAQMPVQPESSQPIEIPVRGPPVTRVTGQDHPEFRRQSNARGKGQPGISHAPLSHSCRCRASAFAGEGGPARRGKQYAIDVPFRFPVAPDFRCGTTRPAQITLRLSINADPERISPVHALSVIPMDRTLGALSAILVKARDHAVAHKIDEGAFLNARLFPDMLPLVKQVQLACDFGARTAARLAGADLPGFPDTETSFDALIARIAAARAFMASKPESAFADAATRPITVKLRGADHTFTGAVFLTQFATPNFYFHATTAYALLRHGGVALGKADFMGA